MRGDRPDPNGVGTEEMRGKVQTDSRRADETGGGDANPGFFLFDTFPIFPVPISSIVFHMRNSVFAIWLGLFGSYVASFINKHSHLAP